MRHTPVRHPPDARLARKRGTPPPCVEGPSEQATDTALDLTLAALADPARRAIIGLLLSGPKRPSEIADALSTTRPAVSRHLRVLREAGLVREELQADDARVRIYELQKEPFAALRTWLEEVESFWTDQLHAFKRYAEDQSRGRRR